MSYPSDLRDKDWDLIKPHFATRKYGNRAIHSRRSLVGGILNAVKTGCQGHMLPMDFSPWKRVFMAIFAASSGLEFGKKCWLNWVEEVFLKRGSRLCINASLNFQLRLRANLSFKQSVGSWSVQIAWLNWARRLSKDFEQKCIYSENIIRLSAIALTLRQIH